MTLERIIADVNAEEAEARSLMAGLLWLYDKARTDESLAKADKNNLGDKLKAFLQLNPELRLWDGERGYEAFLQERRVPGHTYDHVAIRENNPALWERLIAANCLRIDHAAAVAAGLYGDAKRYEVPAGTTTALQVVKVRERKAKVAEA